MSDQDFNIGSDIKFTLLAGGLPLFAAILTSWEPKQQSTRITSKGVDGIVRAREVPEGWELDLEWDRGNPVIDNFIASEEQRRFDGLSPTPLSGLETCTNPDRSVSRYRYEGMTIKLESAGMRKGDDKVAQKATCFARRRIAV